jgi:hypothetical protein
MFEPFRWHSCPRRDADDGNLRVDHGAGDVRWYWHLVVAELGERGHDLVAPDLPCDDDSAGLSEYADTVIEGLDSGWALVAARLRQALLEHARELGCDCGSPEWLRSEQLRLANQ